MRDTVINILTSNRISELCICLTSLINQTCQEWDLVIIDDCSQNPCTDYKFFNDLIGRLRINHCVKYLRHNVPEFNIGKTRNEAVELSKKIPNNTAKYIIRIDDDSLCDEDYVKHLVETIKQHETEGVVAVGGVVPVLAGPNYYRKTPLIFNEAVFNEANELMDLKDDGGYDYAEPVVIPSHHLRSSFLFLTHSHDDVKGHPLEYGPTGFREETDFSFRLRMKGGRLLTHTGAVCYHQIARSGGARMPPEVYNQQASLNDKHFRDKMKLMLDLNEVKL